MVFSFTDTLVSKIMSSLGAFCDGSLRAPIDAIANDASICLLTNVCLQ